MNGLSKMLMRMLVSMGVRSGVDLMEKRGRDKAGDDPAMRQQANATNKRMRESIRMMRRLFRF